MDLLDDLHPSDDDIFEVEQILESCKSHVIHSLHSVIVTPLTL